MRDIEQLIEQNGIMSVEQLEKEHQERDKEIVRLQAEKRVLHDILEPRRERENAAKLSGKKGPTIGVGFGPEIKLGGM